MDLTDSTRRGEKQITGTKNEHGDVAIDSTDFRMIKSWYFELKNDTMNNMPIIKQLRWNG